MACIPPAGGHPGPCPAPGRASITRAYGRRTPPRRRNSGHGHHHVVLSDRLLVADPRNVVWLLPTPEFRLAAFESRGTTWDIPDKTSNPARAYRNLLERDRLFTDRLRAETKRLGLPAIDVDTSMSEDELTELVTRFFGL